MQTSRRVALLSAACWPLACSGYLLRGASSVNPYSEPVAQQTIELHADDCRDAAGKPATYSARLAFVQQLNGAELLLERRQGFDSIVIDNVHSTEQGRTFAYLSDAGSRGKLAHRFELGRDNAGTLELGHQFRVTDMANGFSVKLSHVVLRCELRVRSAAPGHKADGGAAGAG